MWFMGQILSYEWVSFRLDLSSIYHHKRQNVHICKSNSKPDWTAKVLTMVFKEPD